METKAPSESRTIKTEIVCPNDTNPMGMLQGGRLVEWMDIAAAICGQVHTCKICVTVSMNNIIFLKAAKIGDIVTINASITKVFNTSMEIFVEAYAREVSNPKKSLIGRAYFIFVALDENGKSTPVIDVCPTNESEQKLYAGALIRKQMSRNS